MALLQCEIEANAIHPKFAKPTVPYRDGGSLVVHEISWYLNKTKVIEKHALHTIRTFLIEINCIKKAPAGAFSCG
ncbi:MAG: hypothetical protein ACKOWD_16340 [Rhodoferax sp.]